MGDEYRDFKISVEAYENNSAEKDTIISQTPKADRTVKNVKEIKVILSSGSGVVVIGNYMGESFNKIEAELQKKGLEVVSHEESSDNFPTGIIIRQEPASGSSLEPGEIVTLYVSKGSANAVVPNTVGLKEDDAKTLVERSNLVVGEIIRKNNDDYQKGLVYDQSYTAFTKVPEGTLINLFVSDGPDKSADKDNDSSHSSGEKNDESTASAKDETPKIEEMKTKYLSLNLPTDRTKVTVKLVCDGKTIYEKEHNTASGTADISLKSRGTVNVDIYYDNEFVATKEVKFD